jgi:hypothetical protein
MLPTNIERRLTNAESRVENLGMTESALKEELIIARNLLDAIRDAYRGVEAELEAAIEAGDGERIRKAKELRAAYDAQNDELVRKLKEPPKRAA